MIPRRTVKIKFFLSVVIYVVKAAFVPFSATGGKHRKRRCHKALRRFSLSRPGYNHGTPKAGALPTALHPVIKFIYPAGRILPNLSGILFPLVYSGFRRFLICFTYSLALSFPLFPGTPAPSVVIYVVKNASRPVFGENSPMPDGKRFSLLLAAL